MNKEGEKYYSQDVAFIIPTKDRPQKVRARIKNLFDLENIFIEQEQV